MGTALDTTPSSAARHPDLNKKEVSSKILGKLKSVDPAEFTLLQGPIRCAAGFGTSSVERSVKKATLQVPEGFLDCRRGQMNPNFPLLFGCSKTVGYPNQHTIGPMDAPVGRCDGIFSSFRPRSSVRPPVVLETPRGRRNISR